MALPSLALPCRPRSLCSHTPLLRANAITSFNHNFVTRLSDCYRVRPPIVTSASVPQPFATTAGLFLSSRKSPVKAVNEGACNRAVRHASDGTFSLASLLKIGRNNERGARKEGERASVARWRCIYACCACARAASRRPFVVVRTGNRSAIMCTVRDANTVHAPRSPRQLSFIYNAPAAPLPTPALAVVLCDSDLGPTGIISCQAGRHQAGLLV